jgi:hypothetical protein
VGKARGSAAVVKEEAAREAARVVAPAVEVMAPVVPVTAAVEVRAPATAAAGLERPPASH